jgi:class 3 adenylate cyclase
VTFLFTDIEGSTQLWDRHPNEMRVALEAHDALLRVTVETQGGYVFATGGDGFCVAFQRASAGLEAVLAARNALHEFSWPKGLTPKVRMSLHTGEAIERAGDYLGPSVNRASRLLTVASGDQIVVSGTTASLIADRLPAGVRLVDAGTFTRGPRTTRSSLSTRAARPSTCSGGRLRGHRESAGSLTTCLGQSIEMKRLADDLASRR